MGVVHRTTPASLQTPNAANSAATDESVAQNSHLVTVIAVLSTILGLLLLYLSYKYVKARKSSEEDFTYHRKKLKPSSSVDSFPCGSSLKISHSLPDISDQIKFDDPVAATKKVLRQTTLPAVPTRHQSFQRQMSHKFDKSGVKFSICDATQRPRSASVVGSILPELYRYELLRQDSTDTLTSGDTVECGKLRFTLRYDDDIEGLIIKILRATGLPAKEFSGSADPYIKIYLLPDRKKKFQTNVMRKNLNPEFNEIFIFSVSYSDLRTRTLQFSVYDFDRFSRHDLIGQVVLKGLLDTCDLKQEMEFVSDILTNRQDQNTNGELMVSLCYLPTAGRLTVTIIKARNLKPMDITGMADPYVKVALMCQGKRIKKKKSSIKKRSLNPIYNEALVFDVPSQNIEDVDLLIKVIDYDRIGANELMGCCAIGPRCIGAGRDHWFDMLTNVRRPVAQWYPMQESVPPYTDSAATSAKPKPLSR